MSLDPRFVEAARELQRTPDVGRQGSALGPVRHLIAEFIFLEMPRRHIYAFIERVDIKISYSGMHYWLDRHFGRGKDGVRKATAILQRAADEGVYASPYFKPRRAPATPLHEGRTANDAGASGDNTAHQGPPTAVLDAPAVVSSRSDAGLIPFTERQGSALAAAPPLAQEATLSGARSSAQAESDAREAERIRLREERVRKGRAYEKRMLEANPFRSIEQRQKLERLKNEGSSS